MDIDFRSSMVFKRFGTSVFSFQLRSELEEPYLNFLNYSKILIKGSARLENFLPTLEKILGRKNSYQLGFPSRSPIPGLLVHSDNGSTISTDSFSLKLSFHINSLTKEYSKILNELERKFLLDKNLMPLISYGSVQPPQLSKPLFEKKLLLSQNELFNIIYLLETLANNQALSWENLRDDLVESYKRALSNQLGISLKVKVDKKTPSDIIEQIVGIRSESEILNKYTIRELQRAPLSTLILYQEYLQEKIELLSSIRYDKRDNYSISDEIYYQIPLEYLP